MLQGNRPGEDTDQMDTTDDGSVEHTTGYFRRTDTWHVPNEEARTEAVTDFLDQIREYAENMPKHPWKTRLSTVFQQKVRGDELFHSYIRWDPITLDFAYNKFLSSPQVTEENFLRALLVSSNNRPQGQQRFEAHCAKKTLMKYFHLTFDNLNSGMEFVFFDLFLLGDPLCVFPFADGYCKAVAGGLDTAPFRFQKVADFRERHDDWGLKKAWPCFQYEAGVTQKILCCHFAGPFAGTATDRGIGDATNIDRKLASAGVYMLGDRHYSQFNNVLTAYDIPAHVQTEHASYRSCVEKIFGLAHRMEILGGEMRLGQGKSRDEKADIHAKCAMVCVQMQNLQSLLKRFLYLSWWSSV